MDHMHISQADIAVLVLYFLGILAAGIFAMFRSRRNSVKGYFLAGRYMTWLPVGASLFASNIGSEHFIGLAGSGASKGIAVGAFEFNAAILLQLLGWVFLPVYIASGVCTLPEYMRKRFGGSRIQLYLSVLSLILYIFTKISVNLYSGALFVNEAIGWNIWYAILFLLAMTTLITLTGGLTAVLYTDLVQCFVMLAGTIILTSIGFSKINGFEGLVASYHKAIVPINVSSETGKSLLLQMSHEVSSALSTPGGVVPTLEALSTSPNISSALSCSLPSSKAFVLLRGISDSEMPWLGFLFGQTPASIWYWCADQMMVQRVLAAKSLSHAQGATLMAGTIKLIPLFVMVIPGMISRVLYPSTVGCGSPDQCYEVCGNRHGCSDWAYPKLVMGIMPQGLRGLMLAVMLAALMSDLTSIFNSSSTLFTVDIYTRMRKQASNRELMIVGRVFVLFMVGVSILWVPVIQSMQGGQLYIYIQSVSAYLSPPIAAVYLLAILWRRTNELGAFTGLMYGFLLGVVRMILGVVYKDPECGEIDTRPWVVGGVHYMYFAMFSFFSTGIIMSVVSLLSKPPADEHIHGLTFATRREKLILQGSVSGRTTAVAGGSEFFDSSSSLGPEKRSHRNIYDVDGPHLPEGDDVLFVGSRSFSENAGDSEVDFKLAKDQDDRGDEESDDPSKSRSKFYVVRHVFKWICGFADFPCPDEPSGSSNCFSRCYKTRDEYIETDANGNPIGILDHDENWTPEIEATKQQALEQAASMNIEQKHVVKVGLIFGLIFLSLITIFLYLFFTFFFGPILLGPAPVTWSVKPVAPDLLEALYLLERESLISVPNA